MADSADLKMSGGEAPRDGGSPEKAKDAVELKDMSTSQSKPEAEGLYGDGAKRQPPVPAKDGDAAEGAEPTQIHTSRGKETAAGPLLFGQVDGEGGDAYDNEVTESSSKGKEKETGLPPLAMLRQDSLAIGPHEDDITPSSPSTDGPMCHIILLLHTGARHPYKLTDTYLKKRNVNVPAKTEDGRDDPFSISVYTLKELILREWRDEWDQKPVTPNLIRLIFFGKFLDDKLALRGKNICLPSTCDLGSG
jgi:hypothetical protein